MRVPVLRRAAGVPQGRHPQRDGDRGGSRRARRRPRRPHGRRRARLGRADAVLRAPEAEAWVVGARSTGTAGAPDRPRRRGTVRRAGGRRRPADRRPPRHRRLPPPRASACWPGARCSGRCPSVGAPRDGLHAARQRRRPRRGRRRLARARACSTCCASGSACPGSKNACEQGECGSCSVTVDGALVCACLVLRPAAVEPRDRDGRGPGRRAACSSDVQQAFVDAGAVQCGFCTPGLVMAVHDLLDRDAAPRATSRSARRSRQPLPLHRLRPGPRRGRGSRSARRGRWRAPR